MGSYSAIPLSGIHPAYAQLEHQGEIDQLKARSLMLQPQIQQQQIEANQLAIEQQRRQVANQEIMRRALTESGGEPTKFSQLAAQYGASPDSLMALGQHFAQMRHHGAQADESEFNLRIKKADALQGAYDGFLKLPEEEKQRQFPTFSARQKARGAMTDEEATQFDQHYGGIYPGDANWASDAAQLGLHSKLMAEGVAAKNAATRQTVANTAQTRANTAAEESKRKLPSLDAKAEQDTRANLSVKLANAPDALSYEQIYDTLPENYKTQVDRPWEWDAEKTPAAVRRWGLTSAQAATDDRAATREQRMDAMNEARIQNWQTMRDQGERRLQMTANGLTAAQRQKEADAIDKEEQFLHKQRLELGEDLATGKFLDKAGQVQAITNGEEGNRPHLQARFKAYTSQLQNAIFKKAKLYGYATPDLKTVEATADKGDAKAPDGSVWRKQDGIMYPESAAQPAPSQAPPQAQPNTTKTGRDNLQNWNTHLSKAGKTVKMKAPNGEIGEVPAGLVEDFKKKGATLVQ